MALRGREWIQADFLPVVQVVTRTNLSGKKSRIVWEGLRALRSALVLLVLTACGGAVDDPKTTEGRQAVLDSTRIHLSNGECNEAVDEIEELYKSVQTDNEVRLVTASAYACVANVNFFKLLGDLATNADSLATGKFWGLLAKLFPSPASDPNDKAVEGAILASDALMSAIKPGAVILPEDYIDAEGFNPGSTLASDRIDDANLYLLFVSLAAIGAMENRYGAPDPATYQGALPWTTPDHLDMKTQGCSFASSVLNFVDTVGAVANSSNENLANALNGLKTAIADGMDLACKLGCDSCALMGAPVACDRCPTSLRNRRVCAGETDDVNSCAAAGLVTAVNAGWLPL